MKQPTRDHNNHFKHVWVTRGKWILSVGISPIETWLPGVPTAWWASAARWQWASSPQSSVIGCGHSHTRWFHPAFCTDSWTPSLFLLLPLWVHLLSIPIAMALPFTFLFIWSLYVYQLLEILQLRWSRIYTFRSAASQSTSSSGFETGLRPSVSPSKAFQLSQFHVKNPREWHLTSWCCFICRKSWGA